MHSVSMRPCMRRYIQTADVFMYVQQVKYHSPSRRLWILEQAVSAGRPGPVWLSSGSDKTGSDTRLRFFCSSLCLALFGDWDLSQTAASPSRQHLSSARPRCTWKSEKLELIKSKTLTVTFKCINVNHELTAFQYIMTFSLFKYVDKHIV